jgi:hypothetical protein
MPFRLRRKTAACPLWPWSQTTLKSCPGVTASPSCCRHGHGPPPKFVRRRNRRSIINTWRLRRRALWPSGIPTGTRPNARCGSGTRPCSTTASWRTSTFWSASRWTASKGTY